MKKEREREITVIGRPDFEITGGAINKRENIRIKRK